MTTIAFFNTQGRVGTTSLVYHLAWMYADMGLSVLAADFDPQANLTTMFLTEERLEHLWLDRPSARKTVYGAFNPLQEGTGDIADPHVEEIAPGIDLLAGDPVLSSVEDDLSCQWPACLDSQPRAFQVLSGLWRILARTARITEASLVLVDVGPNLGALNRAALVATEKVVIPLAPDLYSLQGLRNLGPTLKHWRKGWKDRLEKAPQSMAPIPLPSGSMQPVGYVVLQHALRLDRPVQVYRRWGERIPDAYSQAGLAEPSLTGNEASRCYCLATLKHYRSLVPLAQEARKPMFFLKPADGAIGGHTMAVTDCYHDFHDLAVRIAERCDVSLQI